MASLNLSTNGPSITRSYQSVVDAPAPTGPAASSPTYGQWAVFVVSTPLVNAFQQDSAGKESVLKVQSTGEGELVDLIDEFSDGRTQFAYVKVRDPNTGLPKNVLICWCGEGVPERTKGYFMNHQAAVSKLLHGYHVQITARSDRDLTPEGIVQKVADSSGSKYSSGTTPLPSSQASKPPVASKPVFTPTRTGGAFKPLAGTRQPAAPASQNVDEDGWGEDAPPVTRTQLEKVQPAYQPTKVNMEELRSQKTPSTSYAPERSNDTPASDVVKGGYQPVGKVDIAEIRRQAKESGTLKDDRPEPVKGTYEPVGKVDIAAIRSRAQAPSDEPRSSPSNMSPAVTGGSAGSEGRSIADRSAAFSSADRLTSLPKPKVANKFAGGGTFTGTKAPLPGGFDASAPPPAAQVGSASRTFADQGGKTPAQLWAERKARERGGAVETPSSAATPIQSQTSGGDGWKSSYTGKSWAPVQTGQPSAVAQQPTGEEPAQEEEEQPAAGGVSGIRDRFANAAPMGATAPASTYDRQAPSPPPLDTSTKPSARGVPIPGLPSRTEDVTEGETHQEVPPPPQQPRSPTPESTPGSPIRVAMPVARSSDEPTVTGAREEPAALPIRSINVPQEEEIEEEPAHDPARAVAQAAASQHEAAAPGGGIRALVQYDYEKAEDNEIDLREGEYVTNIDMVDEDWWMGVNANGESGLFPRNYVEVIENEAEAQAPQQPPRPGAPEPAHEEIAHAAPDTSKGGLPTATALYDYEAAEDNEIGFPDGAKITNIEFPDEDWWHGEYNGRAGLFPANYVQLDE